MIFPKDQKNLIIILIQFQYDDEVEGELGVNIEQKQPDDEVEMLKYVIDYE